jgi:hypothetical protein
MMTSKEGDSRRKEEQKEEEVRAGVEEEELTQDQELLSAIKKAHDLAKAVKLDDAEVPKHLWDAAVCRGTPSTDQARALVVLRVFMLRIYRKCLWREI